jgi:hypothetical protein
MQVLVLFTQLNLAVFFFVFFPDLERRHVSTIWVMCLRFPPHTHEKTEDTATTAC